MSGSSRLSTSAASPRSLRIALNVTIVSTTNWIAGLSPRWKRIEASANIRAVVLTSVGRSFSAGTRSRLMRRIADQSFETTAADADRLAALMHTLDRLPKPTLALVQGPAYGGGIGLVACCDVIATERASFALSEVTLGLDAEAPISPYVINATRAGARRYFQSGEALHGSAQGKSGSYTKSSPRRSPSRVREKSVLKAILQGALAPRPLPKIWFSARGLLG